MKSFSVQDRLRRHYYRTTSDQAQWLTEEALRQSAIVFAPHPDDETLGCGGTIIKKQQAGAKVSIVFMTDGRTSHGHLMDIAELTARRADEAIAAAQALGIARDDVIFLNFVDGSLTMNQNVAAGRVAKILEQRRPQQIFLPYYRDQLADHAAANRIVRAALQIYSEPAMLFEYPIWFWEHWPWVSLPRPLQRKTLAIMRNSLQAGLGLRLVQDFRYAVHIGDILNQKRNALNQHRTQMFRLKPGLEWAILSDVYNGQFLACFFQEYEFFRGYQANIL